MKKYILLTAFIVAALAVTAQNNAKTQTEIRRLEQAIVTAIIHGDTNTLKQLWAPEFLVNNPRGSITTGRDSVMLVQKAGWISYSLFERNIESMLFQKDVVIAMGHERFISRQDSPGVKAGQEYKRRFTNVWMKKKGSWQQVARHASIICQ